jgi:hypothetical protein
MDGLAVSDPGSRAGRRQGWDHWRRLGTSGDALRTTGGALASLARAYLAVAVFIGLINSVNVLSNLHDAAKAGRVVPAWIPITAEFTAGVGALIACGLVYGAMRLATPGRALGVRVFLIHAAGTMGFCFVHVTVMMSLRVFIYAALGRSYHVPLPGDLLYEYRKDVLAYAIIAGLFWLFQAPGLGPTKPSAERQSEEEPPGPTEATFDIVDGAKILRVPVRQILAVRAVRNYVEFLLEDGRTPLMRGSLAAVEAALQSRGLLRSHRSWLINANRLRSLVATGSGDYRLELDGGVEVPLSRRFPATLERLRHGGQG